MFFTFLFYQTQKSTDFKVLRINSPTEIVVDINHNSVADRNEIITLSNVQSFSVKSNCAQAQLARRLKITNEDALKLGFLAENFAKETLSDKKVKLEDKKSTIIINGKNYEKLLIDKGFAIKNNGKITPVVKKNLEHAQKLNLRIFNNKSHKYHKLNCKYGLMAHNFQIIPAFQLPKDAKPCKFCLGKKEKKEKIKKNKNWKYKTDLIPDIKSPATIYQTNSIKIFLTDFTRVLKPSNNCNTPVCKSLVNEINSAQSSIDFAIYGYTKIPAIQNALLNAQKKGVKIRFIYDLDDKNTNIYPDTLYLSNIFKNNRTDSFKGIMHDKFFIFDNKIVLTGSANISNTDMSGFNSNAIILINSKQIADIYSQEFEQMYEGRFHKLKSETPLKQVQLDNTNLQVYFSPQDRAITTQVIPLINNAQKYVYVSAFLITHKQLSQSLINATKRGVSVKIILDAINTHTSYSKLKLLRQHGIQVKTENYAGKLHSKSLIIDDIYTVIGSMNFSKSGEDVNDENLIVIKSRKVALFYKTFFQYLWKRIPDKWLKYNARSESPDSIGSCSDGIDNDFDGKIDKSDDSCKFYKKNK